MATASRGTRLWSPFAGTTRYYFATGVSIGGWPFWLAA